MIERRRFIAGSGALAGAALVSLGGCSSDGGSSEGAEAATSTAAASGGGAAPARSLPVAFTPVLVATVGKESAPVKTSDGRWRVLYELVLTNAQPADATIERLDLVDVDDTDQVIRSFDAEQLTAELQTLAGDEVTSSVIAPNTSVLLLLDLAFDASDDVPDAVAHRIVGTASPTPRAAEAGDVDYVTTPFELASRTAATIGPPLRGGRWVALNGLEKGAGVHRGSIQSVDGALYDAQRFAIDWMLLSDDDRLAVGDESDLANFPSYGQPILAVADGTVVKVVDDLDDQIPGALPAPGSITIETVDGNHVILEIGDGVYAFYAHLQKGEVPVAEGDRVSAGDQIGLLGNSGNTSGPHLHLHLMTAPNPLGADSIPYVFDAFELDGELDQAEWESSEELAGPWTIVGDGPDVRTEELPVGLSVVAFPGGDG